MMNMYICSNNCTIVAIFTWCKKYSHVLLISSNDNKHIYIILNWLQLTLQSLCREVGYFLGTQTHFSSWAWMVSRRGKQISARRQPVQNGMNHSPCELWLMVLIFFILLALWKVDWYVKIIQNWSHIWRL